MSDISLENQLLRAVDIVVTGELDQLELDKTILAVVEEKPLNRFTGEHTVRYQDSSFKAYSTNPNLYYEPGTMVYVQIPKNDFSEKKIITGGKSTVPGDILASNLFYGDTTTINGGNIQTGTIDAGAITLGARNVSLTGRFTANYSTATTPLNGHLWYEGGEIIIPGSSWAEAQMIGPFTVVSGDKCVSPLADTVYWIYAEISGSTLNDIFIPNPSLPALIKTGTSIPEDTEESIKIKVGIWQTDSVKKGVLALSIGQTYINGNEIITGTVIADYMRVGGGATQIGVDEFYNESKSLILTASSPIYSFDSFDTLTPSNQSITFTANLQHLDIDDLEFTIQAYDSEGTLISSATPSLDINDNQAILNASELSSDYFSIKVTATAEGYSDFITINKVKDGADGASGPQGEQGPPGSTGPGILFRGAYNSSEPYYADADRRDVVSYNNNYYIRKPVSSGSPGIPPSSTSYWAQMASFASVATDFLLAQDAQITKVLNIGKNIMSSSANITLNGDTTSPYFSLGQTAPYLQYDKSGIFIGKESNSYKFSLVSSDNTKKLLWDGTNFSIIGGAIKGATITGSTVQTAEPGTARVVLSGTVNEPGYGYCWVNFETNTYSGLSAQPGRIGGYSEFLEPQVVAGSVSMSSPAYGGVTPSSITLHSVSGGLPWSEVVVNADSFTVYPKSTNDYLNSAFIGTDANYHTVLKLGNAIYPGKPSGASGGGVTLKGLNASKVLQVRNYNDSLYGDVHADTLVALTNLRTNAYLQMKEQGGTNTLRDLYLWTDGTTWQLRFFVGGTIKKLTFTN